MKKLGTGVLNWYPTENQSDRYGCVHLRPSLQSNEIIRPAQIKSGTHGRLVVIVREVRSPSLPGNIYHKIYPKTPEVGQVIILGEGKLFFEDCGLSVGLLPDDGRDYMWLDICALYNAHGQTVTLYFDDFWSIPVPAARDMT